MLAALAAVVLSAQAAELALPRPDALQGRAFAPRADARHFLLTEDARRAPTARARLLLAWDQDSLVARYDLGAPGPDAADTSLAIVGQVWTVQPVITRGFGPVRLTGSVPLHVASRPDVVETEAGMVRNRDGGAASAVGDPHLGLKGVLLDQDTGPLGLAAYGRLAVPLGAAALQLGQPGVSGELGLALGATPGPVELGLSLGWRFLPEAAAGAAALDDQLATTLGAALPLGPGGLSAELWGMGQLRPTGESAGGVGQNSPIQLLAGGWLDTPRDSRLRLLGGTGLTPGIGAATARVVLSVEGRRPGPRAQQSESGT